MISSFWLFWKFFGQRMAPYACRVDFLHKRIVHNKFQLKIPTLSKNDCSATWKPNTYQKYDTCGKVRNVQRYQKYVVILRSFIFIVSDIFKPTVYYIEWWVYHVIMSEKLTLLINWFEIKINSVFLSGSWAVCFFEHSLLAWRCPKL